MHTLIFPTLPSVKMDSPNTAPDEGTRTASAVISGGTPFDVLAESGKNMKEGKLRVIVISKRSLVASARITSGTGQETRIIGDGVRFTNATGMCRLSSCSCTSPHKRGITNAS